MFSDLSRLLKYEHEKYEQPITFSGTSNTIPTVSNDNWQLSNQ